MGVPYDLFTDAFLAKITEYDILELVDNERTSVVDGYMFAAIAQFKKNCRHNLLSKRNDSTREFDIDIAEDDIDELVGIISEGMIVQWLKPYVNKQELLENLLNTRDFTTYSPGELLYRVGGTYDRAKHDYTQMIREYSYNHANLRELHL